MCVGVTHYDVDSIVHAIRIACTLLYTILYTILYTVLCRCKGCAMVLPCNTNYHDHSCSIAGNAAGRSGSGRASSIASGAAAVIASGSTQTGQPKGNEPAAACHLESVEDALTPRDQPTSSRRTATTSGKRNREEHGKRNIGNLEQPAPAASLSPFKKAMRQVISEGMLPSQVNIRVH